MVLLTHAIVEAAKALGGSFKLVMLAPRTVREMTQLLSGYSSALGLGPKLCNGLTLLQPTASQH